MAQIKQAMANSNLTRAKTQGHEAQLPDTVLSVAQVAEMLHLKPAQANGKPEWHGPNPNGSGATKDGFILFAEGMAFDRKAKQQYSSPEVAQMAGLIPSQYEPCREHQSRKGATSPARPPQPPAKTQPGHNNGHKPKAATLHQTIFEYHNSAGGMIFQVIRKELEDGSKDFPLRQPDGRGGWLYTIKGLELVLYCLPAVLDAQTVFVCEGEKCAERLNTELRRAGFFGPHVATTNPLGAGKWREAYTGALSGKAVVVLPDNDEPGERHGSHVCRSASGSASSVRLLNLPGLPVKGDICNFLNAGGTLQDLLSLVEKTPQWRPQEEQLPEAATTKQAPRSRFRLRSLAEIEELPPQPAFIEGVAPSGCLFGLVGPYGCGKSFVALDWALCAATGRDWHGRKVKSGPVVYITPEGVDAFGKRTRAWRIARGAERPDNFHLITDAPQIMQPGDVGELLRLIETMPEPPALVVIDTVARHMVGGDENGQRDMGLFVDGVDRLRKAINATVLVVHHTGKDGKMRGSTALPGALEVFVEVQKIGEKGARLTSGKAKDEAPFAPIDLIGRVVDLGALDANGHALTSLVFDLDGNPPKIRESGTEKTRAQVLEVLAVQFPKGAKASEWQKAVEEAGVAKQSAFYNYRDALVSGGAVIKTMGRYIAFDGEET